MYCNNCGQIVKEDDKYCSVCGAEIKRMNVESTIDKSPNAAESSTVNDVTTNISDNHFLLIQESKELASQEMKQGILWFLGGTGITLAGYIFAPEGGTFYVFWGAMIYGIYKLIRGLWYKLNPGALLKRVENQSIK